MFKVEIKVKGHIDTLSIWGLRSANYCGKDLWIFLDSLSANDAPIQRESNGPVLCYYLKNVKVVSIMSDDELTFKYTDTAVLKLLH